MVALQPDDLAMWVRGGRLLSDELGLYMDALQWWQDARHHAPEEVTPIVEQAAILADMGLYGEASDRLQSIFDENMDLATTQYARVARLHQMCQLASEQPSSEHFKPWEKHHDGWEAIKMRMNKPPISESKIFLLITTPILMLEVIMAPQLFGSGFGVSVLPLYSFLPQSSLECESRDGGSNDSIDLLSICYGLWTSKLQQAMWSYRRDSNFQTVHVYS